MLWVIGASRALQVDTKTYTVSFTLRNVGREDGAEIAQLYVSFPPYAGEPPRLLRRFAKVRAAMMRAVTCERSHYAYTRQHA